MATPTQSAAATEPRRAASHGLSVLLSTEPKRATLSVMPSAKASSLVWNHCVTKALCATDRFSPPRPKNVRPSNMPFSQPALHAAAKMACPSRMRSVKRQSDLATPHRSTIMPPMSGSTMLGNEYTEYRPSK